MNSSKCFVPICENTTGVPFPKQEDLRAKWLEALGVQDVAPTDGSFVCLDHFLESDLVEGAEGEDSVNTLKPDAVPSINLIDTDASSHNREPEADVKDEVSLDSGQTEGQVAVNEVEGNFEGIEPTSSGNVDKLYESSEHETIDLHEENETENLKEEHADSPHEDIEVQGVSNQEIDGEYVTVSENHVTSVEGVYSKSEDVCEESRMSAEDEEIVHEMHSKNEVLKEESYVYEEYQQTEGPHITDITQSEDKLQDVCHQTEKQGVCNITDTTQSEEKLQDVCHQAEKQGGNVCRLCMGKDDVGMMLNDIFEDDLLIKTVVKECLYPLQVSEDDDLPQNVCSHCLKTLKVCHDFRLTCFEADKQLAQKRSPKGDKRKHNVVHLPSSKRSRTEAPPCDVIKQKLPDNSRSNIFRGELIQMAEDHLQDALPQTIPIVQSPPPLVPIKHLLSEVNRKGEASPFQFDSKYKKVEEELRRVLEGSLSQDMMTAENIIIEVQSDDEEPSHSRNVQEPVKPVTRLKLPLKLKGNTVERRPVVPVNKIALPKGIRVCKFQSDVGNFQCCVVKGLYDTEFCQGDGYLFEFRLCKGNTRSLRCVVPSCPAMGRQKLLPTGMYEDKITVTTSHNHEAPSKGEQKKQMFFYVMKRKMQNERTLNFRTVYEEVCKIDPEIKSLVPLRNVINEICRHQLTHKLPLIATFNEFYSLIEEDVFQKLHFTVNGKQFYQERFAIEDGTKAVIFANQDTINNMSHSKIMYVDASFKIDTQEVFTHQLVTVLVWYEDSYYPVAYALVNRRTQEIFRKIFQYLHDTLAPSLRPEEIITDYEANLYYALGETYLGSHIGGSCFYYTQNLYKKICALNLSRELETNSYFRNIYHMLLMLPLLPVNTILDGLHNIEAQARELELTELTKPLFDHVRTQWIQKVTPELFCVHRLENRINENVIAPFKKLRDFLMLSKGKLQRQPSTIVTVVEKVIELEAFLRATYGNNNKKSFARDLSSSQKKNVIRAWLYIENHPKININNFFTKVLGYIKCMENQLWIWGFYRYKGDSADDLINAINFSIVNSNEAVMEVDQPAEEEIEEVETHYVYADEDSEGNTVVMEAVIDEEGGFVLTENGSRLQVQDRDPIDIVEHDLDQGEGSESEPHGSTSQYENAYLKYVYREDS